MSHALPEIELEIEKRAAIAGAFHVLVFLVFCLFTPFPKGAPPGLTAASIVFSAVALVRITLYGIQKSRFSRTFAIRQRATLFRLTFLAISATWGLLGVSTLAVYAISVPSFLITLINVSVATAAMQAFGLDLALTRIVLPLLLGPAAIYTGLHWDVPGFAVYSAGSFCLLAYIFLLSRQAHQMLRELVSSRDLIQTQHDQLATIRVEAYESSRMASLSTMAAGVSHEINNPLQTIRYATRLLRMRGTALRGDGEALHREILRLAETLDRATERAARIVTGLTSFSRDGKQDPFESVNFVDVLRSVLDIMSGRLKARGIDLFTDQVAQDLVFQARATQIGHVLIHLLNNSYDAIEHLPDRWIRVSARSLSEERIEVSIIDSGQGIPPDVRSRIMLPFFTTKDVRRGTGLGLTIARSIVEGHEGTFYLDETSPYTRFVLTLPKKQQQARAVS